MKKSLVLLAVFALTASTSIVFANEGEGVETPEVAVVDPEANPENEITVLDAGVEVTEEVTTEATPEQVVETTEDEAEPTENTVNENVEVTEESKETNQAATEESKVVDEPQSTSESEDDEEDEAYLQELVGLYEQFVAEAREKLTQGGWTEESATSLSEHLDRSQKTFNERKAANTLNNRLLNRLVGTLRMNIDSLVPKQDQPEQPQQPEQPKEDKFLEEIKKLREEVRALYHAGYDYTTISYEEISLFLADVEGVLSEGGSLEESAKEEILRKFEEFKKQLVPPTTGETPAPENPEQGEQPKPGENPKLEAPKPGETPAPEAPKPGESPKEQKAETQQPTLPNTGDAEATAKLKSMTMETPVSTTSATQSDNKQLPQTGETDSFAIFSAAALTILTSMGMLAYGKREEV